MSGFPAIQGLIPQAGPMCLLRRVLAHDESATRCEAHAADATVLALDDGTLPAIASIELMAQCIAVHGGLLARLRQAPPRPGLLLGTRRLELREELLPGTPLWVTAEPHRARATGLSAFDCRVEQAGDGGPGPLIAKARLNVYIAESLEGLLGGGSP